MASNSDRPEWYARAYALWRNEFFDTASAELIARSEWQNQRARLDSDERPITPPAGRLVGVDRNG